MPNADSNLSFSLNEIVCKSNIGNSTFAFINSTLGFGFLKACVRDWET